MVQNNEKIIQVLAECAAACNHCATACLEEQDVSMLRRCIKLDLDCAAICRLTADFISRGSEHTTHIIETCIELCETCAEECEKHSKMDHCKRCAEVCRSCAEVCESYRTVAKRG